MLLQHLNDFANSRKLLDDPAFEPKAVRWIIPIDSDGKLVGKGPIETVGENKNKGKIYLCPKTVGNKNAGGIGDFLADGITSLFRLESDPESRTKRTPTQQEKRDKNNNDKFDDFWRKINDAHHATQNHLLKAIKQFQLERGEIPSFLEWNLSENPKKNEKPAWWITTSSGEKVKLGTDNFSFNVEGNLVLEEEDCIKPYWREVFREEQESLQVETGLCLITGDNEVPIERSHPEIKRVPGGQPSGSRLVSFEKSSPSFSSFGLKQGSNAPCSVEASKAYTEALKFMIFRGDHSVRLGPTICCFWTRNKTNATSAWGALLNDADPKAVADFLKSPWSGQERELLRQEQFYAVTLAGNSGRIVVRHWMQTTLEIATESLRRWFSDLDLEPVRPPSGTEKMPPLGLFRLACATVRDAKDLKTEVIAQLFRAALEGTAPSLTLLHPILNRLRVDIACDGSKDGSKALSNHSRFALAKLILNRNRKDDIMEIAERQTADTGDAAYQCGRLLAVLAETQAKAHDYSLEGAGVVERYFGTAMASPASVFPVLLKLNRHHLSKIGKSDKYKGHERFLDEAIQDVLTRVNQFPRTLDLHAQGRFAIGFYQQKAEARVAREAAKQNKETDNQ